MRTTWVSLFSLFFIQGGLFAQTPVAPAPIARLGVPAASTANDQGTLGQVESTPPLQPPNSPRVPPVNTPAYSPPQNQPFVYPPVATSVQPAASLAPADSSAFVRPDNSSRFWAGAEYVFWFVQGSKLPPLVTASPAGTSLANAGVLGAPGTTVLLGDQAVNSDMRSGGRFALGGWLDDSHTFGLETDVQLIGGNASRFLASSDGSQILARPFVDATTSAEIAELVSFPGITKGAVAVQSNSDPLIVADVVLRNALCGDCCRQVDFLVGYRYLHFAESLQIEENLTTLDPLTQGTNFQLSDRFATRNDFNGALVGLETQWKLGCLSLDVAGKLAFGDLRREVDIIGSTVITAPGAAPLAYPGGLLAFRATAAISFPITLSACPSST